MPDSVRVIPTETYFALVRQSLADTGQAYVRVTGASMMPLLRHMRDGVIIVPPRCVRVGDIVLFDRLTGRYALHRVIFKGKNGFVMAGDNQWHLEWDLPYSQVVGVVDAIDRDGRRISCNGFFIKLYARLVTGLTFPRIYIWKGVKRLARSFRHCPPNPGKEQMDED